MLNRRRTRSEPQARAAFVLLGLIASLLATSAPRAGEAAPAGPNIVFILADDLGWADVGFHGGPFDTPNLDALAAEGLRLEQHYVQSLCSPTRAELLTGRYASRLGLVSFSNKPAIAIGDPTLASILNQAGYFTALAGKWHLGTHPSWNPNRYGFDESYGALAGGLDPFTKLYRGKRWNWFRNGKAIREKGHVTDLIAAQAVQWIEQAGQGPFFLYLPFTAVHTPMKEPDAYLAPYADRLGDERERLYGATVSHLDAAIGQILAALRRTGHDRDTLVVFTSDNGAPDPEHNRPLRDGKGTEFEGGIRVPTIVRWKGRIDAGLLAEPVAMIDWLPTLTKLAGVAPSAGGAALDGVDIWPLLTRRQIAPVARTLYWRSIQGSAVRHGNWKLVTSPGNPASLFDLEKDPGERADLSAQHPARVTALLALLEAKEAAEPAPRKER